MFAWLFTTLAITLGAAPTPLAPSDLGAMTATLESALTTGPAADAALARLRDGGPEVFDVLVRLYRERSSTQDKARWEAVLDHVARQRHAWASGLYWYTDLEVAKLRAQKEHKPILSLRLLGDLDELFSCANSRFFRTLLYPEPAVAAALHDGFILHWESVRKAPRIRIDFGNGKVLERTITGNSLHYILDWNGNAIDAFPGLASATAFKAWLDDVGPRARAIGAMAPAARIQALIAFHQAALSTRLDRWRQALREVGVKAPGSTPRVPGRGDFQRLEAVTTEAVIAQIAAAKLVTVLPAFGPAVLDAMSRDRGPIAFPTARMAAPMAITKMAVERPMLRSLDNLVNELGKTLMKDEVQNDLVLHAKIHLIFLELLKTRLTDAAPSLPLVELTGTIYADAFLTPLNDPFMGLAPPDVFTAIPPSAEKTDLARDDVP